MRQDTVMAISTGGIIEGWGAPADALRSVMREVAQFRRPGTGGDVLGLAHGLFTSQASPDIADGLSTCGVT